MNQFSKILLYPFAAIYWLVTWLRNDLYDRKILKSVRFDFPVISVGNLTTGGTGKTPHVEYLIFVLQYIYKVATISRGYGRRSTGFIMAEMNTPSLLIGDEPRLFKAKFPDTAVAVAEDRVMGIPRILDARPDTDVILMDDAFQHRNVRPGLSLLVTEYSNLFTRDEMFPVGWLREQRSGYKRADIIIVSKCPADISNEERNRIVAEIKPYKYQKIYFSTMQYGPLYSFYDARVRAELTKDINVLLLSGIAKHEELEKYLQGKAANVYLRTYRDHHRYDPYDLDTIRQTFTNIEHEKKIIVTTEKDAARLEEHRNWFLQNKIEIFVQPIAVQFLGGDGERFNADIQQYIEVTKQRHTNNGG